MMARPKLLTIFHLSLGLASIAAFTSAAPASDALHFPPPTGPYRVGLTAPITLTDASRTDILAPVPDTPRHIALTIYYPSSASTTKPTSYLPASVAKALETLYLLPASLTSRINVPASLNAPPRRSTLKPLLFSPGLGASRLVYTALLTDLASHGYTIAALDHPYDAVAVDITVGGNTSTIHAPDGMVNGPIPTNLGDYVSQRVADTLFVTRQLHTLPAFFHKQPKRIGVFGHSLGGATAAYALAQDTTGTLVAGINLDGSFWGAVGPLKNKPFLIVGGEGHNSTMPGGDESWAEFRATHGKAEGAGYGGGYSKRDWVRELAVAGSGHLSFSDFAGVIEMPGVRDAQPADMVRTLLGTIRGERVISLQRKYVRAFMDWAVGGHGGKGGGKGWVEKLGREFAEVSVVE
ncbi:Alpha/Beta hydrolase protein [Geopyxis carbonaria]|nr:Alpha/Beta hydrolase protein [Geopyxis carbonaria]